MYNIYSHLHTSNIIGSSPELFQKSLHNSFCNNFLLLNFMAFSTVIFLDCKFIFIDTFENISLPYLPTVLWNMYKEYNYYEYSNTLTQTNTVVKKGQSFEGLLNVNNKAMLKIIVYHLNSDTTWISPWHIILYWF